MWPRNRRPRVRPSGGSALALLPLVTTPIGVSVGFDGRPTGTPGGMNKAFPATTGITRTALDIGELAAHIAASVDGDSVINDIPDVNAVGQITLPNRLSSGGWVVIRPSDARMANLPPYESDYLALEESLNRWHGSGAGLDVRQRSYGGSALDAGA